MRQYLLLMGLLVGFSSLANANELSLQRLPTKSCNINLNQMPQFQVQMNVPEGNIEQQFLVIRVYQAWGDGSDTGWQTSVIPPTVTLDGMPLEVDNVFSYEKNGGEYLGYGSIGLGYDQYAQYFLAGTPYGSFTSGSKLTMTGSFPQAAYLSANLYSYGDEDYQATIIDKQMTTIDNTCNPYLQGNPSVFAYPPAQALLNEQISQNLMKDFLTKKSSVKLNFPKKIKQTDTGKIDVYRLDQDTSKNVIGEDIAVDGCSDAYLTAQKTNDQEVIILRIKVPNTFIDNDHPDKRFRNYDVRYFSIGAHRNYTNDIILNYWTVNARMLNQFKDKEGYAYVFFAPNSYTNSLAIEQNAKPNQPPVMTWGRYKGYLLGNPDFSIILRYRDPSPTWKGSPIHAACYATPNESQPVTTAELGDYTPEIFGDTMDNFLNGKIGSVSKDRPWPKQ